MDPGVLDTNVYDEFSRSIYDKPVGLLWKGLSRGEGNLSNQYHLHQALRAKGSSTLPTVQATPLLFPPVYQGIAGKRGDESPCVWCLRYGPGSSFGIRDRIRGRVRTVGSSLCQPLGQGG
jgi:hypothetical protein